MSRLSLKYLYNMLNQESEYRNGRLNIFPSLWRWAVNVPAEIQQRLDSGEKRVFDSGNTDGNQATGWFETKDGRVAEMVAGKGVICPNVDLWPDHFPHKNVNSGAINGRWVAMSACRKCEHYRSTKQTGLSYASCHWASSARSGEKTVRLAAGEVSLSELQNR